LYLSIVFKKSLKKTQIVWTRMEDWKI